MPDTDWGGGEARIRIPGVCLSPAHLRQLTEKRVKRKGRLSRNKPRLVAEEFVYVPYYYFRFVNPRYLNRYYLYDVLVDEVLGFSEFIRGSFELKEFLVSRELLLERIVPQEEAEKKARKAVESFVLRRQSWWVKEIKAELKEAGELCYPYWVCYLETRKGIELFALNGLTGNPAGPRAEDILRAGIARAEWKRDQR
ncbi:MAG: hypothetical protein V1878_06420 [bacterium]